MVSSRPEAFQVLLVCSWNIKSPNIHSEMLATRELCLAETVGDLLAAALRSSRSMWSLRYSFGRTLEEQAFPQGVMQTYMHDTQPEPSQMCRRYMPEMARTFCDDEDVRQTLLDHAGKYSIDLYNVLQSPAHRADLFRYVYLYEHGGLYLDIKCSLRMPFGALQSCLAEEWGTAQAYAHSALGHCPSPAGQLPKDYMVMARNWKRGFAGDWLPRRGTRRRCCAQCLRRRLMRPGQEVRQRLPPARRPGAMRSSSSGHLNGNDVLDLIFKGLCLSEDQPGYLSCRHCLSKRRNHLPDQRWGSGAGARPLGHCCPASAQQ